MGKNNVLKRRIVVNAVCGGALSFGAIHAIAETIGKFEWGELAFGIIFGLGALLYTRDASRYIDDLERVVHIETKLDSEKK